MSDCFSKIINARAAPSGRIHGAMPEAVERHGEDDDRAGDDLLDPVGQADLRAAVADDGHDHGADETAEDRALAAGEAGTADHYGGDRGELVAVRGGGIAHSEIGE